MVSLFWWLKKIALGLAALFFLAFGIGVLESAYRLSNPIEFVMFFFSASLVILISIVGIIYPVLQVYSRLRASRNSGGTLKLLALVFLMLLVLPASLPTESRAYDLEREVKIYTLANGLKVLMLERDLSPTVSCYIRYRVGAVYEKKGETGIAHLLEHMMFKGTTSLGTKDYCREKEILAQVMETGARLDTERKKGSGADPKVIAELQDHLQELEAKEKGLIVENEIDTLYTENGAVGLNASTGQDLTTYEVSIPANKLELWARIESDRMSNPVFREFYTERDVVMEERRQRVESDPEGKLYESFLATAFSVHPYGRPILGWPDDMLYLSPTDMQTFFEHYHAPNNTVIAIVGNIDADRVKTIVDQYFGAIPAQIVEPLSVPAEAPQKAERRVDVPWDANPELLIGFHKPALPDANDYVFDVIDTLLTGGRTSRLYKTLVLEKKLAQSVQSANGIPGSLFPNLFAIFITPLSPHNTTEVEKALYEELERLKTEPVSPRELEKVKNILRADFIRGLDSNPGLASSLSYYEALIGDYRYMTRHLGVIDKITPEDIMRVAKNYLTQDNRTVATLVKK
ncbi:MAG: pitrilysin family protein [Smithellaceae bacterium]|nr:pitrilysin family protein [Smithellaceae bacterium]